MSSSHTRVQTAGRSTLPEISQYPNVHKLFRNEVISTTTNNEEQVHEDNNIGSRPKNHGPKSQTTPAVRLVKKVEVSEVLHEETILEQDADGYLEKKHKRFLCKWKSYKDYY
ncbi:uncharacterized protein LOC121237883 isoform X2 [Juglans microcarpa x Juglans regia]|uniref:uncharacterized protein LOC121237883 isoform X1 n=1 Tax=Juglans microcarpa x Juglans regia TaxID=2249226 RepID=UPI001B7DD406|nr:uncharacterized protein LOC121237883 isoform X1 [Juglans microcarpa x Juglans regia]XP_040990737.1 uncharacterized protein LOC121237883 isoform X2 [Juglans microcarpa x Juglans regia]